MELTAVALDKPEDVNLIFGQAHFIKTVEDIHEAIISASPRIRFGVAFCESSGDRLVRHTGNDQELTGLATKLAQKVGAGHSFIVLLREGYPINVLNALKSLPTVCTIYCATANPVEALIAQTDKGRGVLGVVDGGTPLGVEADADITARKGLLRKLGYKL